jgi:hypothetical protein
MSKRKKTFTDPQTGEEIESTAMARWGTGLVIGLASGAILGLFLGLGLGVTWGLFAGLGVGLFTGMVVETAFRLEEVQSNSLAKRLHDGIARRQHLRRQRILRRQEFPHVPDGALSLARPPGEPEPTAASLSLADPPEEATPRLAAGVDAATAAEENAMAAKETR